MNSIHWLIAALVTSSVAFAQPSANVPPGGEERVFAEHCAVCHENPATRAPSRSTLHAMAPRFIVDALTSGIMKAQGSPLSVADRVALAEYLTGQKLDAQTAMAGRCTSARPFSLGGPSFNGWGANLENWRYQSTTAIRTADLGRLEVKWVFRFPGAVASDDGKVLWTKQLTSGDMGNIACLEPDKSNCPEPHGPDADLGGSANLVALPSGKRVLTIGQKSGMVWALDPDDEGRIVWRRRIGKGGLLGGVQWGTASDGARVYAAVSDIAFSRLVVDQPVMDPTAGGGLFALDVVTGAPLWYARPATACVGRKNCSPAQSAAVTAAPGYVLSGSVDGHVRAYSSRTGAILWDYDTARSFETVNGVKANGGSLDAAGPTIAGGMLFVNSGYGLYGGMGGNVLIAFAPRR